MLEPDPSPYVVQDDGTFRVVDAPTGPPQGAAVIEIVLNRLKNLPLSFPTLDPEERAELLAMREVLEKDGEA